MGASETRRCRFNVSRAGCRGCRGVALTRWGMSECACAVRHSHILSRFLRVCVTGTLAQYRQFLRRVALHGSAQIWQPDGKSFCRFRAAAVPRDRQTGSRGESHEVRTYTISTSFRLCAVCDAVKTADNRQKKIPLCQGAVKVNFLMIVVLRCCYARSICRRNTAKTTPMTGQDV